MTDQKNSVPLDALLAHRAWVRAVARSLVHDPDGVDDVEQEVWLSAMRRPPTHAGSLRGWLGAATRNVVRRLRRDAATRQRYETSVDPRSDAAPAAEIVAEAEMQQRIARAVLDLPEPFRSTVLLRYFDDLQPAAVAARLGVPVETVRSRLRRARERLRAQLDDDSGGRRSAWMLAVLSWPEVSDALARTAVTTTAATWAGGLVMKKFAAAAVVVIVLGATAWFVGDAVLSTTPSNATDTAIADAADDATRRRLHSQPADTPADDPDPDAATSSALPPPVDLDSADRDLDLHGTVTDADGNPIPGASIAAIRYPWRIAETLNVRDRDEAVAGPATRAASDGTFLLRLARAESWTLRVGAEGYAAVEYPHVLAGERLEVVLHRGARLHVTVIDANGSLVAGVDVSVVPVHIDPVTRVFESRATTDADGRAVVTGIPPGLLAVVDAHHPEKGLGRIWSVEIPATGDASCELRLAPSRAIKGRVIDAETRLPIAGARVGMGWTLRHAVTTESDGTYTLPGWTPETYSTAYAQADGYPSIGRQPGDSDAVEFELARGYAATGRVVNAAGRPIADARVSMVAAPMKSGDGTVSHAHTRSAADGTFRIDGLRIGMRHVVVVLADGHARHRTETPTAASTDDIDLGDIALAIPRRVEGEFVTADEHARQRQTVFLSGPKTGDSVGSFYGKSVTVATDDLGRFRFDGVAPGTYSVVVRPRGGHEISKTIHVSETADTLGVRLEEAAVREVSLTVRDESGAPVVGATFTLTDSSNRGIRAQTDASGVARARVPTGAKMTWSVFPPMGEPDRYLQPQWTELPTDTDELAIELIESAYVTGRLVDPDGKGVANAWFHLLAADGDQRWARADDAGAFRCQVRKEGVYQVVFDGTVHAGGRGTDSGLHARVDDVAEGDDIVVTCTRVDLDRTLTVRVLSPTGSPVAEAPVFVRCHGRTYPSGRAPTTDADGRVTVDNLPARDCDVRAIIRSADYVGPLPATVLPDGEELVLHCRAAIRITGKVTNADGTAQPYGSARALRNGETVTTAQVGRDGTFTLMFAVGDIDPVRITIDRNNDQSPEASADDIRPGARDVELVTGE